MTSLAYRYTFDSKTLAYTGITYNLEEENATTVQPHFREGYITTWAPLLEIWTLQKQERFHIESYAAEQYSWNIDLKNKELKHSIRSLRDSVDTNSLYMSKNIQKVLEQYDFISDHISDEISLLNTTLNKSENRASQISQKLESIHYLQLDLSLKIVELKVPFNMLAEYFRKPWYKRLFSKVEL